MSSSQRKPQPEHQTQTQNEPQIINIKSDAQNVFTTLQKGGIAIIPANVGYGIVATTPSALQKIFLTKQRKPHKKHAMIGSYALHKQIHILPPREAGMVKLLTVDLDLPLGVVAPFRAGHPIIRVLRGEEQEEEEETSWSVDGTLSMLVNGGAFQEELSRLAVEAGVPLMGSSANFTGHGTKVVLEDIEEGVRGVADVVVDYGRQKFSYPRASSTMLEFGEFEGGVRVVRFGACYDVIRDVLRRFYGVELPEDPGREVLFSGHLSREGNVY